MTAALVHDRKKYLGASDVAAIVDGRGFDVWLRKTAAGETPNDDNAFTRAGTAMEPVLAAEYEIENKLRLLPIAPRVHPDYPMIAASPDRVVDGYPFAVEFKFVTGWSAVQKWGDGPDDFPPHYGAQAMVQNAVFDFDAVDLYAWVRCPPCRTYRIGRDRDAERVLLDAMAKWWERYVVRGEQPHLTSRVEAADQWLRKRWPASVTPMRVLDPKADPAALPLVATFRKLSEAADIRDRADADFEAAKIEAIQIIAESDGVTIPGLGKVTFKKAKDGVKRDWETAFMLAAAHLPKERVEAIIAEVTRPTVGSRRFLMSWESQD